MLKQNKGFTLIELLVVIAIIGILASVVLASLNSARTKGSDAAIRANLANIRAQAALYYDTNNTFNGSGSALTCSITSAGVVTGCLGVFDTSTNGSRQGITAAASAAGATAFGAVTATGDAWAAAVPLKTTNVFSASSGTDYYCVDSAGAGKVVDTYPSATATVCP